MIAYYSEMRVMPTLPPYTRPTTKEEYVYAVLREGILSCELRPGQKLIIDRLSDDLGTSPIPIRAALQRLQAEGLVTITPHTGAAVSTVSPDAIAEIFTLSAALESIVMRLLAPKISASDLEKLRAIVAEIDGALAAEDGRAYSSLDFDFHTAMGGLSGTTLLADFVRRTQETWLRLSRCHFSQAGPQRMVQAQAEHRQMLDLLAQRNGPALEALVVQHNRLALQAYSR
jgi:DNA-binding GntR family transcriptional regulator